MDILLLLGGFAALFLGGEALVRGAVGLARRLGLPPLLIGLTVVGFGTSTPELLVSVEAALRGLPDIALGNVVGSNIGNILLIGGLAALVWPIRVARGALERDLAVMLAAALALPFWLGTVGRPAGAALLAGLLAYLVWSLRAPAPQAAADETPGPALPLGPALLWIAAGLVALIVGARLLIDGAVSLARGFGVSEAFIGLTVVAVGTSLPELATSLVAALRRQSGIAIGNIVGSNIFNVLGILGVTALVAPIPVAPRFLAFDLPAMIAASVALAGLLWWRSGLGRGAGLGLLAAYGVYVWAAQG